MIINLKLDVKGLLCFLCSILFGSQGSYNLFFAEVNFKSGPHKYDFKASNWFLKPVAYCANTCLQNRIFKVVTLGYLHTFVHEMGHALANLILCGSRSEINIEVSSDAPLGGSTSSLGGYYPLPFSRTIILLAGPLADTTFSACTLVAAVAFREYLTWPVALLLSISSIVWMAGELTYAAVSTINRDNGDFGSIANQGMLQLLLSTALLIGTCVLSVFSALRYF